MMYSLKTLQQDAWYGKAVLALLKQVPEGTQLEPLIGPGSRIVIRTNNLTILFKRSKNLNKKKQAGFGPWSFTFGPQVRGFLSEESARGQRTMALLVCTGGPIITIDEAEIKDNLNTIGSKSLYVTSKAVKDSFNRTTKTTYSVKGSLLSRPHVSLIRSVNAQTFLNSILKMDT